MNEKEMKLNSIVKKQDHITDHVIYNIKEDQEALKLVDSCFPGNKKNQYIFEDFVGWTVESKEVRFFAKKLNGKLISLCGLYECDYKINGQKIKIAFIGAVCTDFENRGQGYAHSVIQNAISFARKNGISALFLWGSEHSLYYKLGFELCGEQKRFFLNSLNFNCNEKLLHDEHITIDCDFIVSNTIKNRDEGVVWSPERLKTLEKQKNVQWRVLKKSGIPIAYCAFNRGIDLHGIIHEWWGKDTLSLHKLLRVVSEADSSLQIIGNEKLFQKFELYTNSLIEEFLCMSLVLNPAPWIQAVNKSASFDFIYSHQKQWIIKDFESSSPLHLSEQQFSHLLFTKNDQNAFGFKGEFPSIHLWFWGLDSL